jgi:hypothetical protein
MASTKRRPWTLAVEEEPERGGRGVRSCDEQSLPLGDFCDLVEGQVEIPGDVGDGFADLELALDDGRVLHSEISRRLGRGVERHGEPCVLDVFGRHYVSVIEPNANERDVA